MTKIPTESDIRTLRHRCNQAQRDMQKLKIVPLEIELLAVDVPKMLDALEYLMRKQKGGYATNKGT